MVCACVCLCARAWCKILYLLQLDLWEQLEQHLQELNLKLLKWRRKLRKNLWCLTQSLLLVIKMCNLLVKIILRKLRMKKVSEVDVRHIMSNGVLFNPLAPERDRSTTLRNWTLPTSSAKDVQSDGQPFVPLALRFKLQDLILARRIIAEISGGRGKTRPGLSISGHNWPLHVVFVRKFESRFLEQHIGTKWLMRLYFTVIV